LEAKAMLGYSVVVPVYNSAPSLEELCAGIKKALQNYSFEIVLVDDASQDESWKIIQRLTHEHVFISSMQHLKNLGQTECLFSGFAASKGEFIITIDDDLQYDPSNIVALIEKQHRTEADIVYGIPIKRRHSLIRNSASYLMKKAGHFLGYRFNGSSFRLMRKEVILHMQKQNRGRHFLIDVIFYNSGYKIECVDVPHYYRRYGKSNYSYGKLFLLMIGSFTTHCRLLFLKNQHK
jgi:polyisoprenyl-phosphate glycosyltransferase